MSYGLKKIPTIRKVCDFATNTRLDSIEKVELPNLFFVNGTKILFKINHYTKL